MKLDLNFFMNPYPVYAENRHNNTVQYFDLHEDYNSPGFWGIFGYQDALDIFKNSISTSKNYLLMKDEINKHEYDLNLLNRDDNDHARLRKLTLGYFSKKSIYTFNILIETIVESQLSFINGKTDIDLISDFAKEIPINVILEIIGIKTFRTKEIKNWINCIVIDSLLLDESVIHKRKLAIYELGLFVKDFCSNKKLFDQHSLIYSLIESTEQEKLSYDELIGYLMFLIVAGYETTADLIGNSLYLLLNNKDLYSLIINDSILIDSFIEEVLRFESPVQRSTFRVLNENTIIAGRRLKKGDQVRVFIGSANRDENFFENPNIFNIHRKPNHHLGFGLGIHNCLGQFLARAEANICISKIAKNYSHLNLVNNKPKWKISNFSRGLEELKVLSV